jgi:hypothetical protein
MNLSRPLCNILFTTKMKMNGNVHLHGKDGNVISIHDLGHFFLISALIFLELAHNPHFCLRFAPQLAGN